MKKRAECAFLRGRDAERYLLVSMSARRLATTLPSMPNVVANWWRSNRAEPNVDSEKPNTRGCGVIIPFHSVFVNTIRRTTAPSDGTWRFTSSPRYLFLQPLSIITQGDPQSSRFAPYLLSMCATTNPIPSLG